MLPLAVIINAPGACNHKRETYERLRVAIGRTREDSGASPNSFQDTGPSRVLLSAFDLLMDNSHFATETTMDGILRNIGIKHLPGAKWFLTDFFLGDMAFGLLWRENFQSRDPEVENSTGETMKLT